jgi:Acetyltransferase (GNAT) domain
MPAIGEDLEPYVPIGADLEPAPYTGPINTPPPYAPEPPPENPWKKLVEGKFSEAGQAALTNLGAGLEQLRGIVDEAVPGFMDQMAVPISQGAKRYEKNPNDSAPKALGKAFVNTINDFADGLTSAQGVAMAAPFGPNAGLIGGLAKPVSAGFLASTVAALPQAAQRVKEVYDNPKSTAQERAEADLGLAGTFALTRVLARHVGSFEAPIKGGEQPSETTQTQVQQEAGQPTQPVQPVPQDFIRTIPAEQGPGIAEPAPAEGGGAGTGEQPAPERADTGADQGLGGAAEVAPASGEGAQGEGGQAGQEIAPPVETGAAPAAPEIPLEIRQGGEKGPTFTTFGREAIPGLQIAAEAPAPAAAPPSFADAEAITLPNPRKGWRGVPDSEVHVMQQPDGTWISAASAQLPTSGFGEPLSHSNAFHSREAAINAALDRVQSWTERTLKGRDITKTDKLRGQRVIDWVNEQRGKAATVPPTAAEQAGARITRAAAPDGGFAAHPLVQFVMDSGLMSKSTARRVWGKARYEENKSLWDSAPEFPDPRHNKIYSRTGGQSPDKIASDAVEAGLLPQGADASTLFQTLQKIGDASHRQAAIERGQSVAEKVASKQANSFARAVAKPAKGEAAINASDLQVGQTLKIRGENFKVTDIDPDTFAVTLEDGSKFGIQKVADNQVFYGEIKGGGKRAISQGRQDVSEPERPQIHGQAGESVLRDQGIQPPGAQEPVPQAPVTPQPVAPETLKALSPDALRAMLPTADPVTRGRIAWELGNRPPSELRPSAPPPTPELSATYDSPNGSVTVSKGGYIRNLFIKPEARRSGEGTALMKRVTDDADAAGIPLSLHIGEKRGDLANFYERLGFKKVGQDALGILYRREPIAKAPPPTPKLRPGEKGTGDLLQGEDQPFNLAGEKLDESAQKAAEARAQAEQDRKIHDEENQVPFGFGPGGASIHENLNIEPQITQLNATVSKALRSPRNLNPRAAFTKAYQAVGKQFVTAKQSLQGGLNNVRTSWQVMKTILMRPPVVEDFISALKDWHFADTKTSIAVRDFVRNVRKNLKSPLLREAITNYVQADGDMALLAQRAAASNIKYRPGYEAAMKLTPEQQTFAANVRQYFDAMLADGIKAGLLDHGIENYVNQIWKRPNRITRQLQADIQSGKLQTSFQNARRRIFDSFFEGEQKGFVPGTKDIASLIAVYDQAFNKAISGRAFVAALRNAKTAGGEKLVRFSGMQSEIPPVEGESAGAYLIRSRAVPEMAVTKDGRPYVAVDHPALRGWKFLVQDPATGKPVYYQSDMLVHPDYAPKVRLPGSPLSLKSILEPSALRQGPLGLVGKPLLTVGAFAKQTKLSLSIFHLDQEGLHGLFHRIDPANLVQIDLNNPVQAMLVRNGTVLLDYRAHELINEGVRGGGLTAKVPVLGRLQTGFNEFLFRDYIPRLKMTMAMHAFERNLGRRAFKGMTPDQVAEITANQANAAFGELNYRLLGRSQTMQDFLRLTILAPDFLEARSRFVGQALKRYGGEQRAALILGGATTYVAARIMNQFLDNDPHWEPRLAFSVVHNKREYRLRTVMGDLGEVMTDPARFFNNRFSPWLKEGITVATGRDITTGLRLTRFEQLKHALAWLVPISIGGTEQANATQRFLGSAGISNKPARGAINDVYDMARAYKTEVAKQDPEIAAEVKRAGQETYAGSDYARLNMALYDNDRERIVAETEKLIEQKGSDRVEQYYDNLPDKPFTGSVELEEAFLRGLANDPGRLTRYKQAVADRDGMARLFFQLRPYARPKRDSSLTPGR